MKRFKFSFIIFLFICNAGFAQVKFPAWFSDNMVLQQKSELTLWGWSEQEEGSNIKIATSWDDAVFNTEVNSEGIWQQIIKTSCAGGPFKISVSDDSGEYTLNNVMLGEVWLGSGQSNMFMPMKGMKNQPILNSEEIIQNSSNADLRLFTVERAYNENPQKNVNGNWSLAAPEVVSDFSAVGYQFGKRLQEELGVPVGIIISSWGGTPIKAWMNPESLENFESMRKKDSTQEHRAPSALYNAMIAPLTKFPVAGFLWYQGENDRGRFDMYKEALPAMAHSWRSEWDLDEPPFLYVQIAPFTYEKDKNLQSPYMREAQLKALDKIPNSSIVITADIGSDKTIHPPNKTLVADRLAKAALAMKYGRDISYKSPVMDSFRVENDRIEVSFENAEALELKEGKMGNFEIAGEDKVFYPASAQVVGNRLVIYSEKVKNPVAVRYGFKNYFKGNLYNSEGLPVAPFRTDNW